jgi:tetrahydromethanopterin S-methyltransferase subunit C
MDFLLIACAIGLILSIAAVLVREYTVPLLIATVIDLAIGLVLHFAGGK